MTNSANSNNFHGSNMSNNNNNSSNMSNTYESSGTGGNNDDLPSDWVALEDPDSGETYYANEVTGESTWDKPVWSSHDDMRNTATINSPDGITISRIKPTILSGHMSDIQWNAFCEDVDRALAPARELKRLSNWYNMISMSSCLFLGLGLVVLSVLSLLSGSLIFFISLIVMKLAAICYVSKRFQAPSAQLMNGLNEVCNRYSTSIPDVEFKVIDNRDSEDWFKGLLFKVWGDNQRDYIEVTVTSTSGSNVETPMAIATTTVIKYSSPSEPTIVQAFAVTEPSAPTTDDLEMGYLSTDKTSITSRREQRMAELDAMKDRISEDEYYAKRAEILSDV